MRELDTSNYFYLRQLICTYPSAVDKRDYKTLHGLFAENAEYSIPHLNITYKSRDEIVTGIKQIELMFDKTYHAIYNHSFKIVDANVGGEVYCVAMHFKSADGGASKYDMGIRYQDQYVKQDGTWLFARRELTLDWENTTKLA